MNAQRGFTLVELMIAVAIVAILSAIALPAYQDSIRKARRNDGKDFALEIMQLQEQFRTRNFTYAVDLDTLFDNSDNGGNNRWSPEGYYRIKVMNDTGGAACKLANGCIRLNVIAKGAQNDDLDFRLWSTGRKQYRPHGGSWTAGWHD